MAERGEKHPLSKLTDDDVRAIRASKERQLILARRYRVSRATISMVQLGKNWKHVK